MIFNSLVFAVFFAVVYPLFRLLTGKAQQYWLLAASWFFYAWWDWRFLGLLILTTWIDWWVGKGMGPVTEHPHPRRDHYLLLSVIANLSVLGTFKYLGFFLDQLPWDMPALDIILPVGLSFYTFQSMAYTIDVYRGHTQPVQKFWDFALFVSYFPQLVAGPIERSSDLLPQLDAIKAPSQAQLNTGGWLILWGFFKKLFIADNLATIVSKVYEPAQPITGPMVVIAMYAFTLQIYCDFSGYSDIARGISKWMGVELMENFRLPLWAESPRDLWHRWHISLSGWLRDYLYIPLGGNKGVTWKKYRNLLLTMLLGGLWHGANWTFVVWGGLHGMALVLQQMILPKGPQRRWSRILGGILTFHLTAVGFLIFRAHDFTQVASFFQTPWRWDVGDPQRIRQLLAVSLPLILMEGGMRWKNDTLWPIHWPWWLQAPVYALIFLATLLLGASFAQSFIYFQF